MRVPIFTTLNLSMVKLRSACISVEVPPYIAEMRKGGATLLTDVAISQTGVATEVGYTRS